jgi:hypothetical protein
MCGSLHCHHLTTCCHCRAADFHAGGGFLARTSIVEWASAGVDIAARNMASARCLGRQRQQHSMIGTTKR